MPVFNNDPIISNEDQGPTVAVEGHAIGTGVAGTSSKWFGVVGSSTSEGDGGGVFGKAIGPGVIGKSETWHGVHGETTSTTGGAGVHGKGGIAGLFEGKTVVKGELVTITETAQAIRANFGNFDDLTTAHFHPGGGDYAENFASEDDVEPGTVLVIGDLGLLTPCQTDYDTRASGVVSGAGSLSPGSIMQGQTDTEHKVTVALAGQVYAKADATYGAISIGDLLTTSPTKGYAMRVDDRGRAVGAIIGKALSSLDSGTGLVRMMVLPC